jgi:hypothetical protein
MRRSGSLTARRRASQPHVQPETAIRRALKIMLLAMDGVRLASTNMRGGPRASVLGCVGIEGSQANQAGAEIRYLRRLRPTIDGKTLFSQAFGLTVSPAGESGHESSVRLDDPPIGYFAARVMRNGLKCPLRGNGACSPDIELPGKHLAKKIGRDEFASRTFAIRAATVPGLGKSIFPGPPKNSKRAGGISTTASSPSSIIFSFFVAFCFGRSGRIARNLKPISS